MAGAGPDRNGEEKGLARGRQARGTTTVRPAQVAWQQAQLLAVLRHRPPGDGDASLQQLAHQVLVAEGTRDILHVDQVSDHLLHAGVGYRRPALRLITGREEVLELKHAVRGLGVLVRDRPAHGGLVHAHDRRDLSHRQRLQRRDPALEEVALHVDDFAGDALDGALALLDGVDQELTGADPLAEVVALVLGERAARDHLPVRGRDAQAGDVVTVEGDLPVVPVALDDHVGHDRAVAVFRKAPARGGVELADFLDRGLHVLGVRVQAPREVWDAPTGEQIELLGEDAMGEGAGPALRGKLMEEASGEVLRADADRVEGPQDRHGRLHRAEGQPRLQRHVGRRLGEEAGVIEAADEMPHRLHLRRREVRQFRLPQQVLLERALAHEGVEHVLAPFRVLGGRRLGTADTCHMIAPVLVELAQDLELPVLGEIQLFAPWFALARVDGGFAGPILAAGLGGIFGRVQTHTVEG
jgi:hypothetical protein